MNIIEYVNNEKAELSVEVASFKHRPVLAIIQVNDDQASNSYIRGKIKDGSEIGVEVKLLKLQPSISESRLLEEIEKVNKDEHVHGLIVQMPLPRKLMKKRLN